MECKHGFFLIREEDNVATALADMAAGPAEVFGACAARVRALEPIAFGHKIALRPIARGEAVVKYGYVIGTACADIAQGAAVGAHNCASRIGVTQTDGAYRPGARAEYTLADAAGAGEAGK